MQSVPVVVVPASPRNCSTCDSLLADDQSRHVCPGCGLPQPLSADEDYFSVLCAPKTFAQNPSELQKRFYGFSRVLHPDRFTGMNLEAQTLSMKRMSFLNLAYETLRNPRLLRDYFLKKNGIELSSKMAPPADLAEAWFEIQDLLSENSPEIRTRLESFEAEVHGLEKKSEETSRSLERDYDLTQDREILMKIAKEIQMRSYLSSLIRDVERIKKNGHSS